MGRHIYSSQGFQCFLFSACAVVVWILTVWAIVYIMFRGLDKQARIEFQHKDVTATSVLVMVANDSNRISVENSLLKNTAKAK